MKHLTSLASSRGLLRSCDFYSRQPVSSSSILDPDLISGTPRTGDAIYVCTDALEAFAETMLPRLTAPFYLASGDSDRPVDAELLKSPGISRLLASEHLAGWHAQNLQIEHPRLRPLPIGLDYHTAWEWPGFWELAARSPLAQETSLLTILAASPSFGERYLTGYGNWRLSINSDDRQECLTRMDGSACFFETQLLPRHSTWRRQSEFMFVVSPQGIGMDCHRTWEALALGCIPIMRRSRIATLFADLPVVLVDDWAEVTPDNLRRHAIEYSGRRFDFSSLFRDYWARRIRGREPEFLPPMTMAEFRAQLTRGVS